MQDGGRSQESMQIFKKKEILQESMDYSLFILYVTHFTPKEFHKSASLELAKLII